MEMNVYNNSYDSVIQYLEGPEGRSDDVDLIIHMKLTGATGDQIAAALGISRNWLYKKYGFILQVGSQMLLAAVSKEAFRLALDESNQKMIELILKSKGTFSDKQEVDVNSSLPSTIVFTSKVS